MDDSGFASSWSNLDPASDSQRITELEAALNISEAKRIQAETELEDVARFLSHDLRAPLRGIDGYSKALAEDYGARLDSMALAYLQYISESGRLAAAVVEKLIHYIRVPRTAIEPCAFDLSHAAEEILEQLKNHSPERSVQTRVAPGLTGTGEPRLVRLLLEYLLENAWKFSSGIDPALIEIDRLGADEPAIFFVRDNGAGYNPTYADQLFRPFQRLHSAHEFEGAGMGLAVAWRIVERHGGRIWAQGQVGRGATFFFALAPGDRK